MQYENRIHYKVNNYIFSLNSSHKNQAVYFKAVGSVHILTTDFNPLV
jgi:hypothetical protein